MTNNYGNGLEDYYRSLSTEELIAMRTEKDLDRAWQQKCLDERSIKNSEQIKDFRNDVADYNRQIAVIDKILAERQQGMEESGPTLL